MKSKMMPKSWKNCPETMLKNSFGKKHQNYAKMIKKCVQNSFKNVRGKRWLGRRKGLWAAGRRFLRRQRLPDPSGIDFPSFLKVFWSLWDPFSIIFWMLILQNCPPKRDQHFHLKTKTASISPAEGRKDGRKEATKKSTLQSARVSPYKQVDF